MRVVRNKQRAAAIAKEISDSETALINRVASLIKLTKEGEWDSPFVQRFKEAKVTLPETKHSAAVLVRKWQPLLVKTTLDDKTKARLAFILEIEASMCWACLEKARTADQIQIELGIPNTGIYFKAMMKAAESMI